MKKSKFIVIAALIGAIYAVATYICSAFTLSYGPIQFRFSEALTCLCTLTPAAIPGLTIGCIISNIGSPYGIWDIIFGSAATFFASVTGYLFRNIRYKKLPLLSFFMPVIFNALFVGAQITIFIPNSNASLSTFLLTFTEIFVSEFIVCFILGIPVYKNTIKYFREI